MTVLDQEFLVSGVAAAGARRQVITAPRRPGHTLVAHRSHPDRRAGLLHRGCRHPDITEVVVLAFVGELLPGEAALDDPKRLKGPAEPLVERNAESAEFLRRRAYPDRQVHPA